MIYQVRRMRDSDVDAVLALAAVLPTAPHWPREAYLAALDSPMRNVQVAVTPAGELLGFAVTSMVPPEAELESIAVVAVWQLWGIARHLLQVLSGELAAAGVTELLLEVRASNEAALAAYRALGFAQTGLRRGYYAHPAEDAVQMRRTIP